MDVFKQTEQAVCPVHGEFERKMIMVLGRLIRLDCPHCLADAEKLELERAKRERTDAQNRKVQAMFQRSGIPMRFQKRSFENYEAKEAGQEKALRVANAYADDWAGVMERGTCLIFSGNAGTGKTHLACAIANAVMGKGYSALYTTVSDALRSIKRAYDKDSNISESEAIAALAEPRLLILDEVGGDAGTEHTKIMLFDVMNKRYENMRPTIVLTNLDAPALRDYFGDRITDRLREGGGKMIAFTWNSHRS